VDDVAPELVMMQRRLEVLQDELLPKTGTFAHTPKLYSFDLGILGKPNLEDPEDYEAFTIYVQLLATQWLSKGAYFTFVGDGNLVRTAYDIVETLLPTEVQNLMKTTTQEIQDLKARYPDLVEVNMNTKKLTSGKVNLLIEALESLREVHGIGPLIDLADTAASIDIENIDEVLELETSWSTHAGQKVKAKLIQKVLLGLPLSPQQRNRVSLKPMAHTPIVLPPRFHK